MYETLAGQFHPVAGIAEAAEKVVDILQAAKVDCVALGELPEDFRHLLESRCPAVGLDVIGPSFNSAELPQALDSAQVGISWAAFAIAETGTLVELTTDDAMRLVSALPEVHGLEKAGDFAPLCVSCGLCKEICPAEIDIPMMIAAVKERHSAKHPHPIVNRLLMAAETMAKLGAAFAPIANWSLNNRLFRWGMEKTVGIDRRRELPPFNGKTLGKRFRQKDPSPVSDPIRRVAFFADLYANYNAPELGMAAIERFKAHGCEVVLPPQKGSGYPYIAYGDLKRARQVADENVRHLAAYAAQGYDIVSTEPTAVYTLKFSYPKLLGDRPDAIDVANRTYEYFEYLEMLGHQTPARIPQSLGGRRLGYHIACHQRALGAGNHAMAYLKQRGADVVVIETGTCCGMAGTFGLKSGLLVYELSQAVGEPLFQAFKESGVQAIVTESSVCRIHLKEGTGMTVWHPLELLEGHS